MVNFSDFYYKLSESDKQLFRDVAEIRLGWGHSTFYYKLRHGHTSRPEDTLLVVILNEFETDKESLIQTVTDYCATHELARVRDARISKRKKQSK